MTSGDGETGCAHCRHWDVVHAAHHVCERCGCRGRFENGLERKDGMEDEDIKDPIVEARERRENAATARKRIRECMKSIQDHILASCTDYTNAEVLIACSLLVGVLSAVEIRRGVPTAAVEDGVMRAMNNGLGIAVAPATTPNDVTQN